MAFALEQSVREAASLEATSNDEDRSLSEAKSTIASIARSSHPPLRVALVGSPNSGKTTLFNALTGLRRKVANYPGVTVDHVEGEYRAHDQVVRLIDLPGTYSLEPISEDEAVTLEVLRGRMPGCAMPDAVLVVADATTLQRSLALVAEVMDEGLPTVLAVTMIDEMKARKGVVDVPAMKHALGIPVVGVVGNRGIGVDDLRALFADPDTWMTAPPTPWRASNVKPLQLSKDGVALTRGARADDSAPAESPLELDADGQLAVGAAATADEALVGRYRWADEVYAACVVEPHETLTWTDRIDRVVLHPVAGLAVFALLMFAFFQVIFVVAAPLQEGLEGLVLAAGDGLTAVMSPGLLKNLVVDGVIAGVGSVVVFLPQIALLLLMIQLLEGIGYMARAAFLVDRVMGWVGLEGRCFIALLSSYACAVPGIMAARAIPDPKARLTTILVAPFMTCSARLPVYGLLIAAFVPATLVGGVISLQGLTMFGLYLLGSFSALIAAALFKRGLLRDKTYPFYMELPPYRVPTPAVVLQQAWRGVYSFLRKAGTIILAASVILWAVLSFPTTEIPMEIAADSAASRAYALEHSYAADVGHAIEPAIEPLGYDWKIGVGLLASVAAREVIVATLGQIYAFAGEEDDVAGLGDRLREEKNPETGQPLYTLATALSLLVFFVYSLQCISTLAVMRRETNGFKWPVFAFLYMLGVAYVAAFTTFQLTTAWMT